MRFFDAELFSPPLHITDRLPRSQTNAMTIPHAFVAALLLGTAAAFVPARRPMAVRSASRVRAASTIRAAATVPPPVQQDEAFPGVAECPFTQWGPRDVKISERDAPM